MKKHVKNIYIYVLIYENVEKNIPFTSKAMQLLPVCIHASIRLAEPAVIDTIHCSTQR